MAAKLKNNAEIKTWLMNLTEFDMNLACLEWVWDHIFKPAELMVMVKCFTLNPQTVEQQVDRIVRFLKQSERANDAQFHNLIQWLENNEYWKAILEHTSLNTNNVVFAAASIKINEQSEAFTLPEMKNESPNYPSFDDISSYSPPPLEFSTNVHDEIIEEFEEKKENNISFKNGKRNNLREKNEPISKIARQESNENQEKEKENEILPSYCSVCNINKFETNVCPCCLHGVCENCMKTKMKHYGCTIKDPNQIRCPKCYETLSDQKRFCNSAECDCENPNPAIQHIRDAFNYKVSFASHKNETVKKVYDVDEGYVKWMANGPEYYFKICEELRAKILKEVDNFKIEKLKKDIETNFGYTKALTLNPFAVTAARIVLEYKNVGKVENQPKITAYLQPKK